MEKHGLRAPHTLQPMNLLYMVMVLLWGLAHLVALIILQMVKTGLRVHDLWIQSILMPWLMKMVGLCFYRIAH